MNKLFTAFGASLALTFILSTASAGTEMSSSKDKQVTAAAAPEIYNWGGFYFGGNAGANWNEFDFTGFRVTVDWSTVANGPAVVDTIGQNGRDEVEFIGGGQAGYNWQLGRWVVGLEGDFQGAGDVDRPFHNSRNTSSIESLGAGLFLFSNTSVKVEGRADTNWFASVRPRVGYTFGPILLYATGGAAFNDTELHTDVRATTSERLFILGRGFFPFGSSSDRVRGSDENTMVGWTVGGGLEWQVRPWLTAGVEYRHSEFANESFAVGGTSTVRSGSTDINLVNDQVEAKVNVLFMNLFRR